MVNIIVDYGFEGDAHARNCHGQISLLAIESINSVLTRRDDLDLKPRAFAENITTEGMHLFALPIGSRLTAGEVELEVSQTGKKSLDKCNIFRNYPVHAPEYDTAWPP